MALTRLRLGHSSLKHHLKRLNIIEDSNCRFCSLQDETIDHLLHICPKFYSEQMYMKMKLQKSNINPTTEHIIGANHPDKRERKIIASSLKRFLLRTGIVDII